MPSIPVGDILRAFVKGGWFRRVLDGLKGTKITTPGGTDILLDKGDTVYPSKGSPFDSVPHKMEPPKIGGGFHN
jgi:hypothetical protein